MDAGDTASFTLIDDAGGRFAIVGNELRVANGSLLDFEADTSHEIGVRVTDGGRLAFEVLSVDVIDLVDAPVALSALGVDDGFVINGGAAATVQGCRSQAPAM